VIHRWCPNRCRRSDTHSSCPAGLSPVVDDLIGDGGIADAQLRAINGRIRLLFTGGTAK
jgi:hypothetical protein